MIGVITMYAKAQRFESCRVHEITMPREVPRVAMATVSRTIAIPARLVLGSRVRQPQFIELLVPSSSSTGFRRARSYALIALGYTMVFGVLRFINFAHGDVFMLGASRLFTVAPRDRLRSLRELAESAVGRRCCCCSHRDDALPRSASSSRGSLQPAARTAATHRAHHRHRRLAVPGELRAAHFRRDPAVVPDDHRGHRDRLPPSWGSSRR